MWLFLEQILPCRQILNLFLWGEIFRGAWRETWRRKARSIGNISGYSIALAFLVISLSFAGFSWLGTNAALEYTGAQFIGFVYSSSAGDGDIAFKDPGP
jgi:hypothetical protein